MKSCLGLIFILLVLVGIVGGGALLWYLGDTAEFTRKESVPPKATPVR